MVVVLLLLETLLFVEFCDALLTQKEVDLCIRGPGRELSIVENRDALDDGGVFGIVILCQLLEMERGTVFVGGFGGQFEDLDNYTLVFVDVHKDLLVIWNLTHMADIAEFAGEVDGDGTAIEFLLIHSGHEDGRLSKKGCGMRKEEEKVGMNERMHVRNSLLFINNPLQPVTATSRPYKSLIGRHSLT